MEIHSPLARCGISPDTERGEARNRGLESQSVRDSDHSRSGYGRVQRGDQCRGRAGAGLSEGLATTMADVALLHWPIGRSRHA
jgi:hypothetical protein